MATRVNRLPYNIGVLSGGWYAFFGALLVVIAWGIFAYTRQLVEGLVVTGLRDIGTMGGAAWGLYVAFDVYFVGVSFAGITVAALIRLFNLEHLKAISRMAELLTIVALILAAFSIMPDLGRPGRALLNLPRYGRPMSPFFGTFTLVISGYLFASLVYFYLEGRRDAALCAGRSTGMLGRFYRWWAAGYRDTLAERQRHDRTSFWLAIAILPLLVTAHSTLGFVFGLQVGRPGWFSALQAPAFVILAGISGIGHLIVIAAVFRWLLGEHDRLNLRVFQWLGNILLVLTLAYLYFMVVEWLTTNYAGPHHEVPVSMAVLTGAYAPLFWVSVAALAGSALSLFVQFVTHRYRLGLIVACGVLVNVAAVGKRLLIVVPSQTHGALLPYRAGTYVPSWVEISVIVGLLALGAFLYFLFAKFFPILEVPATSEGGR